ncbi:MAG: ribbon-helix-helix protein, CopG family [Burkholderiaceae bacterium]|jgi:hypothetical protein
MLTIRLEPEQSKKLEQAARHQGVSKSEFVRRLIDQAVEHPPQDPKAVVHSILDFRKTVHAKRTIDIKAMIEAGRD